MAKSATMMSLILATMASSKRHDRPQYRSLENDGQYDAPKAMDDTVWDRTCRLVVTLETDGGHQPPASVPNTVVPLFTADGGSLADVPSEFHSHRVSFTDPAPARRGAQGK